MSEEFVSVQIIDDSSDEENELVIEVKEPKKRKPRAKKEEKDKEEKEKKEKKEKVVISEVPICLLKKYYDRKQFLSQG